MVEFDRPSARSIGAASRARGDSSNSSVKSPRSRGFWLIRGAGGQPFVTPPRAGVGEGPANAAAAADGPDATSRRRPRDYVENHRDGGLGPPIATVVEKAYRPITGSSNVFGG